MKGLGEFLSSIQQSHVSRLFWDLNSDQFPAVGWPGRKPRDFRPVGQPAPPVPLVGQCSENVVGMEGNYLSNFSWGGGLWCSPRT